MLSAPQPLCVEVLRDKYLQTGESTVADVFARVARALASVEPAAQRASWERRFRHHLLAGGIGAGRIMAHAGTGAGSGAGATLLNCFVQPLGDSIEGPDTQGWPGLEQALQEAVQTLRMGGGVGIDFSRVRPLAAQARAGQARALGPCACIDRFERAGAALQGAGQRRSAQMAVLRIDHPDVQAFIEAKRAPWRWSHFNVSVAVPDAFLQAVQAGTLWDLVHRTAPGRRAQRHGAFQRRDGLWVYRRLPARALWAQLLRAAFEGAEPGVLFIDRIRRDNNLRAQEGLEATNPCGEKPLPPYGSCALAPLVLPRFVRNPFGVGGASQLDFAALARHARLQVRLLDNVLELTRWPLPQQAQEARLKRRIGVGFTGLGDALVMLGLRYDNAAGRAMAGRIARCVRDNAYAASVALARERGAFPLLDLDSYLAPGTFASRLPAALQSQIRRHGIRHSHLLSVAPAGSVSLAFADDCSSGIEPVFAWAGARQVLGRYGRAHHYGVEDHAWRVYCALGGRVANLPPAFVSATEVMPEDHLAMLQAVQPFVDAAISKTVHLPPDLPFERFQSLYLQAWQAGLKGLTVYRSGTRRDVVRPADAPACGAASAGLPAPHFPDLALSLGLSHALPDERPLPRKEMRDVHQGAAGL